MRSFLDFLKTHPLAWVLPILLFAALISLLAWKLSNTPENPFAYRIH